jgi:hypothetical protein
MLHVLLRFDDRQYMAKAFVLDDCSVTDALIRIDPGSRVSSGDMHTGRAFRPSCLRPIGCEQCCRSSA